MKKLLLIPLLFLITTYAKADMDYICFPAWKDDLGDYDKMISNSNSRNKIKEFIAEKCERNNIVFFDNLYKTNITSFIARWCRHDREINYEQIGIDKNYKLICVLYDNKTRKYIDHRS